LEVHAEDRRMAETEFDFWGLRNAKNPEKST